MDYWKEVPNSNFMYHFKWMPFLRGLNYEQLSFCQKQMVNHFEFHYEITTKDLLFKNLMTYAELNKINVFDYVPLTFVIDVDSQSYTQDLVRFTQCYEIIASCLDSDKNSDTDYKQALKLINSKIQQVNLSRERRVVSHCRPKMSESHFAGKNIWLLKATGFNRGRGVSIFDSIDKLKNLIHFYSDNAETNNNIIRNEEDQIQSLIMSVKSRTFVIQKYIERPLLIHNRKFDIRVWVLVTHEMKVYFFKEGYIRTSCAEYSIDSEAIDKVNIHLTNNAVQKYYQQYGEFEDGNQLSFNEFQVFFWL
jgi:hypothetical protein